MSSRKYLLNVISQVVVILAILFSAFAPAINVEAQAAAQVAAESLIKEDISTGLTIGKNIISTDMNVPILSREIQEQVQTQSEALSIKLTAEPAIYIPGKPIVVFWNIVGGNPNKISGLQIVVHPSNGIIPVNTKIIPETDGSVIITPIAGVGSMEWKVLDYAVFPLSINFELVRSGEILNTNSVNIDLPLATTSTFQTLQMQYGDQGGKNKVKVVIPSTASSSALLMDARYPSPNALNSASLSWNPVEILAVDKTTAKNITKFKSPVTIQITYDEIKLFGGSEQDLSIYYYDPDLQDWFPMETTVDTVNNTLTVQSDHLTVFDYKANNWQSAMLPTVETFKTSDFTGAATYQINMWTPPAPGGLQPSVSLSYNSQIIDESTVYQQASWVGMGWNLDTGSITRNLHGTDSAWNDDTFNISVGGTSGLLLPISSSGGITQYNTADQTFMKVEGNDNTYSWTVWTKDGTRYDFAETTDNNYNIGCATLNNHTWRWSLSKVTDIHGNSLNYSYNSEVKPSCANEIAVYPTTIGYGNGKYQVKFVREARADYQTSWTTAQSHTLYETQRLKEVQIQYYMGTWITIKRYVLSYAPNNATNIYPNFTYTMLGKTLTLIGVQEFGSDGSALPAVTFTYGDSIHLTTVNNGQSGSVTMSYSPWQYNDDTNFDVWGYDNVFSTYADPNGCLGVAPAALPQGWTKTGTAMCDTGNAFYLQVGQSGAQGIVNRLIPEMLIKPSGMYRFSVAARRIATGSTTITWGFEEGTITTVSATVTNSTSWMDQVKYLTLPATFTAAAKLRFDCSDCYIQAFKLNLMPTYYRVTMRTVTVQPTNVVSTYTYQYDNASPATVDNSAAVATGGTLYTKKLREFRGNTMSQMTNPEGLTTVNWFSQADGMKGRVYDSLVLKRDVFDAVESLSTKWVTSGGTHTAVAEYQKDFDNSIKSVNGTLIRNDFKVINKVVVAHIRLSGAGAVGQVGIQGSPRVITLTNGSASINGIPLLSGGDFKLDEWYAVMIFADFKNGNRVRIWQLDDPNNFGEAVVPSDAGFFFSSVTNGTIYTDSYFLGTPYSETITRYGSTAQYDNTVGGSIPDIASSGLMTFKDLFITWAYPVSVENRNYNGDSAFVGTKQEFTYATATQFGNLLTQVESGNTGSGWSVYRKTNYEYYPVALPAITPTRYLIGFPARQTVTDASNSLLAETLYFYDGQTAYTSSPLKGDLTTQRVWAGGTDYIQSSMTYDIYGNALTQSVFTEYGTATTAPAAASKQTTTTLYDTDGYNTYPVKVKNQLLQEVNTTYNYVFGLPSSVTDTNNVTTSATYDGFGRMKTITAPGDTSPTLQVNYFDANIPFRVDLIQTLSATSTVRLSRFYDGAGREIQSQTASAVVSGTLNNVVVDTQYNAVGRAVKQTVPYTILNNAIPAFNTQTFTQPYTGTVYDVIGRALTTTAPNQTSVTYTYTDLTTTVNDPNLNATVTTTDVWGRTILVDVPTDPDVSYQYDVLNRMTDAIRAGSTTHINYDVLGRKTSMTDPDMGAWSYDYDALGNLKSQSDAKNQITCLYYDALNRLDGKIYLASGSCGAPVNFNVDYNYDSILNGNNGIGRRTSMIDASGSTVWTYDPRGRLSTESKTITGVANPFITSWNYNSGDQPFAMTYPDGETLTYGYNTDGSLNTVTSSTGDTYVGDMQYDDAGRLKLIQYGNNIINKTFNYFAWNTADMGGLLSSTTAASTVSLQDLAYTYDKNGNVLTIADALAGPQTQTFTYDSLNRILSASVAGGTNGLYSETYNYDSTTGNLSLKNGLTYTYGDLTHVHAVTSLSNGNSYVYDVNGNMTQRNIGAETFDLVYDIENRLNSVTSNAILPPTATPTATVTNTPLPPTATETNTPLPPTATSLSYTLILQPNGIDGVDTYMRSSASASNFGAYTELGIGENNDTVNKHTRSLIKFDLSSLPANATVTSATLSLWTLLDVSSNDSTVSVYRLKVPFSESQATWNISATGVNWQSPGASGANDRESASIGSSLILANEPLNTEKQISLAPAQIQEFISGAFTNNGFVIKTDAELDDRFNYSSSDATILSQRPKLVIQYTLSNSTPIPSNTPTSTQIAPGTATSIAPTETATGAPVATNTSLPPTATSTSAPGATNTPVPSTATLSPTPGTGLTYTVSKTADTNDGFCNADCSLREAVRAANAQVGTDTIVISAGTYALTIVGSDSTAAVGDLNITDSVVIQGAGAASTIISGSAGWADRIIEVRATAANVTLSGVTIQNGNTSSNGGGVYSSSSNLTMNNVIIQNNTVTGSATGAGLHVTGGSLTLTNSALLNNSVPGFNGGGGIYYTGNALLTMTNVTVSGNIAGKNGAGIRSFGGGVTLLRNVTITNNTITSTGTDGAGIAVYNSSAAVTIVSSVIAGNIDQNSAANNPDCNGLLISGGHNLIGDQTGCTITATTGDLLGTSSTPINALLGTLQDNGGNTLTHALQIGSLAINAGDANGCPLVDQRGFTRDTACDMGAFEFGTLAFTPSSGRAGLASIAVSFKDYPALFSAPLNPVQIQKVAPLASIFFGAIFVYDGDGHRVKSVMTTDAGISTTYFVGTHYEVTDGIVTKYYYAGSQRIALRKNGALNFLIGDHLGSTSFVTDASGVVINQTQYKAWGEERYSSGTKQTGYGYTGQYSYAADFGLQFYNARWYDSSLGRFTSADTIVPGGVQGYDRYAYANNNPLNYTDPDGHFAIPAALIAIVIIGAKVIDYGWTGYDIYQSGKDYLSVDATAAQRQVAAEEIQMAITFELLEPDELSPIALPLDDIVRHGDDISEFIFRKGSDSPMNLTPRPGKDDVENGGLSFFDNVEDMMKNTPLLKGDKYIQVDPKKLYGLDVIFDNVPPGHVTVRPQTLSALKDWASTRGTQVIHGFTEIVKNAMVGNPILWK